MKSPLLTLLLLATAASLHAQTAPSPTPSPTTTSVSAQPTDTIITASSAEILSNEAQTETYAIFNGNVVVTGTNLRITCDRIEATAAGRNETVPANTNATAQDVEKFKKIIATGKVRIVQGDREANCERAEVFPREGKIILTGQPVVIDHGAGVTWLGEPMTLLKNERRVQGENVKITFPPINDLGFDKNAPAPKPDDAKP